MCPLGGTEPQACGNNKDKTGLTQYLRMLGTTCKTSQTGTLLILTISNSITLSTSPIQKQKQGKQFTLHQTLYSNPSHDLQSTQGTPHL